MKVINKTPETVGEFLDLLLNAGVEYSISIAGMSDVSIAIDNEKQTVLIDDSKFIEEHIKEENDHDESKN